MNVCLAHDYLTQRGGAERVVLAMREAFGDPPIYTSLFNPEGTFPAFKDADIRTMPMNRWAVLRENHRLAFPLLARGFSQLTIDSDVLLCSSSGWAHACQTSGRKVVYCYSPARWLYQTDSYLGRRNPLGRLAMAALGNRLRSWDRKAAQTADRYLAISTVVQQRIRETYGLEAEVLPPPPSLTIEGVTDPIPGIEDGYFLCVSRLLPYKNVDVVVGAFSELPSSRLIVVGQGPLEQSLRAQAPTNVAFMGRVTDAQLSWLYQHCCAVIAASYEDYGLTPLEGAVFGKPAAALRWGGFLDTIQEGVTGVFFDEPNATAIANAATEVLGLGTLPEVTQKHAASFSRERFSERLRAVVNYECD